MVRTVRTAGRTDPLQPGRPLYYLGRAEDALRSFERALSLNPDLETARAGVRALSQASEAAQRSPRP